jgi:uncharacterized membrane protein YbaN (DUF454 family)
MIFYKALGFFFVGLGILGLFLPLLPTTVFLLLAAGCFARSSDKWHRWLLSNRIFGPIINDWNERKCVTLSTKIVAVSSILLFGGYSISFAVTNPYIRAVGLVLIATGLYVVLRLTVCKNDSM